jgi:hypothetical protein
MTLPLLSDPAPGPPLLDEPRSRKRINTIVPDRVYQRGQILTWTRAEKVQLLQERRVSVVVTLWPKLDPDLAEAGLTWYLYLPVPQSKDVVASSVRIAAEAVARYLIETPDRAALILCEAGRTRSVFFSALVVHYLQGVRLAEAHRRVIEAVPGHALKAGMIEYLTRAPRVQG